MEIGANLVPLIERLEITAPGVWNLYLELRT